MTNQIPDIYKAAIKRYEEISGEKLDDPSITTLVTVKGLTDMISTKNEEFTAFRDKRHKIFSALSTAMRPIELFGNLAAGGASMAFPPSSLVFGAVSYLINAAKGVTEKYDAIVELMETLKDFTVRLEVYNREEISGSLSVKLADVLATLIDIFALSRREIKSGRVRSFTKHVMAGKNPRIDETVAKLAKLTETEDRLVGAETLTAVKQSGRTLDRVSTTVNSTSLAVTQLSGDVSQISFDVSQLNEKLGAFVLASNESAAEMREAKDRTVQERIKAVLRPSVSALDWYDKINRSRVSGTGNWIHGEAPFQAWLNKEKPILWITGNPGAGKSYIASNIITFLRERYPQGVHHTANVSVAYFFFKDDQPATRSFDQALRDMAYQICQNDSVYERYISSMCDSARDVPSLQSIWRTMFISYFQSHKPVDSCVYLVFDGMDESYMDSRKQFLELTKDLQDSNTAGIHIAMLGRPQLSEEFETVADMTQVPTIHISALNNSDDIVTYILNSIRKSTSLRRAPRTLQTEIVDKLSSGAQGMFIWVDFMLKELLTKRNESAIRAVLNAAPRGLNEMIRHVLEGFSHSLKDNTEAADDLNTLLAWVTCAQRPLKLEELDTILKLNSPTGDGNWWLEGTLRIQFASFFILTREDGLTTADLQRVRSPQDDFKVDPSIENYTEGFDDIENDTDFDSDPSTTEVAFCHASIGDFFRNEAEIHIIAGEDCPAIGMQYHDAKVSVMKTHFKVLDSDIATRTKASKVIAYMRESWIKALGAIDLAKTMQDDKIDIGRSVVRLLFDKGLVEYHVGFPGWSHLCQEDVELLTNWVTDSAVFDSLSKQDQEWVLSTSKNRAELFLPLVKRCGQAWLHGLLWNAGVCATVVYAYMSLCSGDSSWYAAWAQNVSEKIIQAAEWCNLEQNALWHRRLAMALQDNNADDTAILHFQKALEMDPSMWSARVGLAVCYTKKATKEAYETAVELDQKSSQELEEMSPNEENPMETEAALKIHRHHCLQRLANSLRKIDKPKESLRSYQKAFEIDNRCKECFRAILDLYDEAERYEDVMNFLRSLNKPIDGLEHTYLSDLLMAKESSMSDGNLFSTISRAAHFKDQMPFVAETYRSAAIAARKQHRAVNAADLDLYLAELYERYLNDSERAVSIWEKITDTYRSIKAETQIADVKRIASMSLARYCLKRSAEIGKNDYEVERCTTILERLGKVKADSKSTFAASGVAIMLGAWYKLIGRDDEAQACFRVQVKAGLRMLSDGDPTNDGEAYYNLIFALVAAGDDKSAVALLWALLDGVSEASNEKSGRDGSANQNQGLQAKELIAQIPDDGKGSFETGDDEIVDEMMEKIFSNSCCDGCLEKFPRLRHRVVAVCRYCLDSGFCQDCLLLCRASQLKINVCSPNHSWFILKPRPKEVLQAREPGKVWFDGEKVTFDEMKRRVAAQWSI